MSDRFPTADEAKTQVVDRLARTRRVLLAENAKVVAWMEAEAKKGNLVFDRDAPGWADYGRAAEEWERAIAAFDRWLAGS